MYIHSIQTVERFYANICYTDRTILPIRNKKQVRSPDSINEHKKYRYMHIYMYRDIRQQFFLPHVSSVIVYHFRIRLLLFFSESCMAAK